MIAVTVPPADAAARTVSSMEATAFSMSSSAAPGRPERAQGDRRQPGRRSAAAGGIGHREPCPVGVLGVVEPVAPDVVAGQHVARHRCAGHRHDPRRQQVLLDLRRGGRRLASAPDGEDVGVQAGEVDRGRRLARDLVQRSLRGVDGEQEADRPPAQVQGRRLAVRQLGLDQAAQARDPLARDLRADGQRGAQLGGELLRAGQAQQAGAVDVDDVQRNRRDARDARGLGDDLLAEQVRGDLVEDACDVQGRRLAGDRRRRAAARRACRRPCRPPPAGGPWRRGPVASGSAGTPSRGSAPTRRRSGRRWSVDRR